MKILIIYFSQTGNTQKIAEAIHEITSQKNESELRKVKNVKVKELQNYDLVFMGSACHDTDLAKPVLRFLKKIPKSPNFKLAGFVTHSTTPPEVSERNKVLFEEWAGKCGKTFEKIKIEKEIDFKGYFRCQGAPSLPIETFIHQTILKDDEEEWTEYLKEVKKHPNSLDFKRAKEFAKSVLNSC